MFLGLKRLLSLSPTFLLNNTCEEIVNKFKYLSVVFKSPIRSIAASGSNKLRFMRKTLRLFVGVLGVLSFSARSSTAFLSRCLLLRNSYGLVECDLENRRHVASLCSYVI